MITCKIYGGIGNQMFQIATTIGLAKKFNVEFKIPKYSLNTSVWKTYFHHFPELTSDDTILKHYNEKGHEFQEIPFSDGMCLNGYFQSEKYFDHCRQDILDAFKIPYYFNKGAISIHVRRGDYLEYPDKHPIISMDYIKSALEYFSGKYKKVLVFSDDIKWCEQNINKKVFNMFDFSYATGSNEIDHLSMMSSCEHNIIANSTFSLWGAYLNQNPDKIVIAPKLWFGEGNSHLDTKDIVPPNYIRF